MSILRRPAVTMVRSLAGWFGYEVRRREWDGWSIQSLRGLCTPATVIDVGVGYGTPQLYAAFPDAFLLLVEPLTEFGADIEAVLGERRGVHEPVAVAEAAGEAVMQVTGRPTQSSLHARTALTRKNVVDRRTVPVTTLDEVAGRRPLEAPYLVKIDTEGHELSVIRGGRDTIGRAECVIAEVSIAERFQGSYRFAELIDAMTDLGFELVDVLALSRGPGKRARRMDAAFARRTRERAGPQPS